ncbi:MAG TPA: type II toxin-antitoxin system RelE/ParE family toxin [Pirellulales bacterium]|nr:type II toxin-antitoxin system RelE/ParE family toxin [Pirellulales bacterium]
MAIVQLTPVAREQLAKLPKPIQARVVKVLERLRNWPAVSGVKALSGPLAGRYRARTGDYRLQFYVQPGQPAQEDQPAVPEVLIVEKIGHRDGFYDDE